jgi:hypothetical protein
MAASSRGQGLLHTGTPARSPPPPPLQGLGQCRGKSTNPLHNLDFAFGDSGSTAYRDSTRARGSNRGRRRGVWGRGQPLEHLYPRELQQTQYPPRSPPNNRPRWTRSRSDGDISPTQPFSHPQTQQLRGVPKQPSNRPLPAPRRGNNQSNGNKFFGKLGNRGYELARNPPGLAKRWYSDENLGQRRVEQDGNTFQHAGEAAQATHCNVTDHSAHRERSQGSHYLPVTAEQVLHQHFTDSTANLHT